MQNYQKYSIYTMIMPFDTIKLKKKRKTKGGQKMKYVVIMIAVLTVGIINGLLRLPKNGGI